MITGEKNLKRPITHYSLCLSLSLCICSMHMHVPHAHAPCSCTCAPCLSHTHAHTHTRTHTHRTVAEISRVQHSSRLKNPPSCTQTNTHTCKHKVHMHTHSLCKPLRPSLLSRSRSHVCAHTRYRYAYTFPYQSLSHVVTYRHGCRMSMHKHDKT